MILTAMLLAASTPCPVPAGWGLYAGDGDMPNSVVLDGGEAYWNATPAKDADLRSYGGRVGAMPSARIILRMRTVDCATLKRVAAVIAPAAHCTPKKCVVDFAWPRRR